MEGYEDERFHGIKVPLRQIEGEREIEEERGESYREIEFSCGSKNVPRDSKDESLATPFAPCESWRKFHAATDWIRL